jgi:hypothetical protein
MKMETVIRSPQKGVIKRLAHKEGVSRARSLNVLLLLTQERRISVKPAPSWSCLRRKLMLRLRKSDDHEDRSIVLEAPEC